MEIDDEPLPFSPIEVVSRLRQHHRGSLHPKDEEDSTLNQAAPLPNCPTLSLDSPRDVADFDGAQFRLGGYEGRRRGGNFSLKPRSRAFVSIEIQGLDELKSLCTTDHGMDHECALNSREARPFIPIEVQESMDNNNDHRVGGAGGYERVSAIGIPLIPVSPKKSQGLHSKFILNDESCDDSIANSSGKSPCDCQPPSPQSAFVRY